MTVRSSFSVGRRLRLAPAVALGLVIAIGVAGCQGSEVRTGVIPIVTVGPVPTGKIATPLKPDPTCLADGDCGALIVSPCARAVCNTTTHRCETGTLPDFVACEGGGPCAAEAACLSGVCVPLKLAACDDDNPCTSDTCDAATGCVNTAKTLAPCTDGNPCTVGDHCLGGACIALDNLCACKADADCASHSSPCLGAMICSEGACLVDTATALSCDDGNPCTKDDCDAAIGGCSHAPFADTTPCDDGSLCTLNERCVQGACTASSQLPCAVNDDTCPTETCDPTAGCVPTKDGQGCDDGNACTSGDQCTKGVCAGASTCDCSQDADCAGRADVPACLGQLTCRAGRCEIDPNVVVPCTPAGQPCVMNLCTALGCTLAAAPLGSVCDDGTACTWGDTCGGDGACVAGAALPCDDGLPCTNDACIPSVGCIHGPGSDGQPCDDGLSCTTDDTCADLACAGKPTGCDDGDPCTTDFCAPSGQGCIHKALVEGATCDDGDACSTGDRCTAGLCTPLKVQDCDDGDVCTQDLCEAAQGCAHPPVPGAPTCDDGDSCTTKDTCSAGKCVGEAGSCECKSNADCGALEDSNLCNGLLICEKNSCVVDPTTVVTCPKAISPCVSIACQPNTGLCVEKASALDASCDDGEPCTKGERCLVGGACGGGAAVSCNDGDSCTIDSCKAGQGCVNAPAPASLGIPCDDGLACTKGDVCDAGACKPGKNTCQCVNDAGCVAFDDGDLCTGVLRCKQGACVPDGPAVVCDTSDLGPCAEATCVPTTGKCATTTKADGATCVIGGGCGVTGTCQSATCVPSGKPACDDGNGCTVDSCAADSTCAHVAQVGSSCDDGDACTSGDVCGADGSCSGGNNVCLCSKDADCVDDGDACNGVPACVAGTCQVKVGSAVTCDVSGDGPCKKTACVPTTGACLAVLTPTGTVCDDGDACTSSTACGAGVCAGGATVSCDDTNACTDDGCNPASGCYHNDSTQACDDGDPCTLGDVCANGACTPGTGKCECQTNDDCAAKDDGNACNGVLVCVANTCQLDPKSLVVCDASKDTNCTANLCDVGDGVCKMTLFPAGTSCDDGSVCTAKDQCSGGICAGAAVTCDDDNPCSDDTCDPLSGCKNTANTAQCEDGNPCTSGDVCVGGSCTSGKDTCGGCTSDAECTKQDDGDLCNGTLSCQAGTCQPTPAIVCSDDGNSCTNAQCQATTGVCVTIVVVNGNACDDGDACTTASACLSGQCVGSTKIDCDDGEACTADLCDKIKGCLHEATIGATCDDGNSCTNPDLCGPSGTCLGGFNTCQCKTDGDCAGDEDGDACNGVLACVSNQCVVKPGSVVVCDPSQDTPCRSNLCAQKTGVCALEVAPNGTSCDDGSVCTGGDSCADGSCVGKVLPCDDNNVCTLDVCDSKAGCGFSPQDGGPCDDGNVCTKPDACKSGSCVGGANACQCKTGADCAALEDGDVCNGTLICEANLCVVDSKTVVVCAAPEMCTTRTCEPKTGACVSQPVADGAVCGGDVLCGGVGSCAKGTCAGTSGCADDGNVCTSVSCDGKGACVTAALNGTCSDGESCTIGDACANGTCVPGTNACECKEDLDCLGFDDDDLCNGTWACGANGKCALDLTSVVTCPASTDPCVSQVCAAKTGACEPKNQPNGASCADSDACTTAEQCFNGKCAKQSISCDDKNTCTSDSCDAKKGCVNTPVGGITTCDDGDPCTPVSICQGGTCFAPINTCFCQNNGDCSDDGNLCNGTPTCQGGQCKTAPGSVVTCDTSGDGDCVTSQCVPVTGKCAQVPKLPGTSCNDGSACTAGDVCTLGSCVGIPFGCDDKLPCTNDVCDPKAGCVSVPVDAQCDDGNVCTLETCVVGKGCTTASSTAACEDGDACTLNDACQGGVCVAGPKNPTCCQVGAPCDDGDDCTGKDLCLAGSCAGSPISCDDGNGCTNDSCATGKGCVNTANTSLCNDGDPCTLQDTCEAGKCVGKFKFVCDDGKVCTDDSCGPTGCSSTNNNAACSDANPCTTGDACSGGACVGVVTNCDDGNNCTTDFCDGVVGCQTVPNAQPCSDNSLCTNGDVCANGSCVGKAITCNDDNPCTQDLCLASTGCQNNAMADGTACGSAGMCLSGTCSAGSDLNPALSCKDVQSKVPGAKSGLYFIDPDGAGAGEKYEVKCDMDSYGGGWMVLDVAQVAKLMTMTSLVSGGMCTLSSSEWKTWDQFDGATADHHFCVAEPNAGLIWPTYTELRVEGVQLVGYTGGGNNTFDAYTNCYGASWQGNFCVGPSLELKAMNTADIQLSNGQSSPLYTQSFTMSQPRTEFQIRTREEGPQLEGISWKTGAILLR